MCCFVFYIASFIVCLFCQTLICSIVSTHVALGSTFCWSGVVPHSYKTVPYQGEYRRGLMLTQGWISALK